MKFSKFFLFAAFCVAVLSFPRVSLGQDYAKEWKSVDSLIKKQYYSQAFDKSQKLYDGALQSQNSWQSLMAAHYLSRIGAMFKEDNSDSSLVRYQRLLPKLTGKEKAVCNMLLASFYADYYSDRRWSIDRNKVTDENDLDYKLWDKDRYKAVVERYIRAAFADIELLKSADAESLGNLVELEENGKDGDLTPTVFDVLVLKANKVFGMLYYRKLNDRNFDAVDDLFATTEQFAKVKTKDIDSVQMMADFMLNLNQKREEMHLSRNSSPRVMTKLYINRFSEISRYVYFSDMNEIKRTQLQGAISHFSIPNDPSITELYYLLASNYNNNAKYVDAVAVIDSAIALHPESYGAVKCYNLKQQILRSSIHMEIPSKIPSGRNALAVVSVSNVDTLFFRIVNPVSEDYTSQEGMRKRLMKSVVPKEWSFYVGDRHDYLSRGLYFAIPPMAQGHYLLIASNNKSFDTIIDKVYLDVEDVAFVKGDDKQCSGFLVDRKSGEPIVGEEVKLQIQKSYGSKKEVIATTKTDRHGHFEFPNKFNNIKNASFKWFVTNYKGLEIKESIDDYYYYEPSDDREVVEFYFDRPVYKPGDTVHFSLFKYAKNRYDGHAVKDYKGLFVVCDINGKAQDTIPFATDEFGVCQGQFAIPADAMPGYWRVKFDNDSRSFKVESYKQPKFTVTLSKPAELREFGKPAHVEGIAASYTSVPLNGATVTYRIVRSERQPRWCWGWQSWFRSAETKVVATGELTTDDQGLFIIEFVPQPDSVSDLRRKPAFDYSVYASVTDVNGETHEASTRLSVGYVNSYLETSYYFDTLAVSRNNLDGEELSGRAKITVELLKMPSKPLLHNDMIRLGKYEMPYTPAEFEKLFPLYDYMDSTADYTHWPVDKKLFDGMGDMAPDKPFEFSLKGRPMGVYKVTSMMITEQGDTLNSLYYKVYEPTGGKMPFKSDLIVGHLEKSSCPVGDTVHLKVGSRFDDVTLYVLVRKSKVMYRHDIYKVSRGYTDIAIPVTDSLLGGFIVEVAAMKENHFEYDNWSVSVPYRHKELDVTFETFRNKLTPGTPERWTLCVKEKYSGQPAKANLLMTMYDAALDNYGYLGMYMTIWGQSYTSSVFSQINGKSMGRYAYQKELAYKVSPNPYKFHILMLKNGIYSSIRRYYSKNRGTARGESGGVELSLEVVEDDAMVENELGEVEVYGTQLKEVAVAAQKVPVIDIGTAESGARLSSDEMEEEIVEDEALDGNRQAVEEPLHVRQNLSTLAFFMPTLRSDDSGAVELSFNAPDLLTKWNIKGLAWTSDLKEGAFYETAITQKRLMVVPNVPRFLRQGDTCIFSVKVSNMDDKEQNIAVTLRMTSPADDRPLSMIVGDTVRHITLAAGRSGEVRFILAVPQAPIFVANYMVVARGQGCSDGELAPIPLLPSRQLVTESMAFYINGKGEKQYEMKHLTQLDTTSPDFTLSTLGLTVDLTPNPIWMVMQSLPYVKQRQNPSNIYLVNSIYTNSLSYAIVKNNPQIEAIFREWEKVGYDAFMSELDRNSDLKQTVMSETPWLLDANNEEQRHRDVARFFNKAALENQLRKETSRLLAAQRVDGGWSWIEGGRYSSLYTTQYILKTFGLLQKQGVALDSKTRRAIDRAMDFVDRETYTYYKEYIKNKGYDVVNLDYLYVRSYYPDNKLSKSQKEAYDFFYNNAKKYNESYQSLFTQSMLSVVFNRHGDTKLAQEMAKRIKEKALYSDEMGMYWRDNTSGWCWNERPIETQAMLIRTMDEVLGDRESVAKMQQWLLKQKQTTNWNTDVSTVNAIQALLAGGTSGKAKKGSKEEQFKVDSPVRIAPSKITLTFGNHQLVTDTTRHQLHISQRLQKNEVTPADGRLTIRKEDNGIAWGAMYWQYFEQVDKIPSSSMGVTLKRTLYRVERDGKLSKMAGIRGLKVGDKVRIRIEISTDRNLEYLELKDPRCAAMEPVNTASGWRWESGLSYYLSITNTAQTLYIDRLDKGKYVVEYDMYVNNAGTYVTAPTTMQCLYAPEFRALCPAEKLKIER